MARPIHMVGLDAGDVDQPDEDHADRADDVREADVHRAGVDGPGLAGGPLRLHEVADRRSEDRQHARPGEPVPERRDRADEREVLAPALVRIQRDSPRLVGEHRRQLGVDPVHEHADEARAGPQGEGAPGADASDRVAEPREQRSGDDHRENETVVPAQCLPKFRLLDRRLSHGSLLLSLVRFPRLSSPIRAPSASSVYARGLARSGSWNGIAATSALGAVRPAHASPAARRCRRRSAPARARGRGASCGRRPSPLPPPPRPARRRCPAREPRRRRRRDP